MPGGRRAPLHRPPAPAVPTGADLPAGSAPVPPAHTPVPCSRYPWQEAYLDVTVPVLSSTLRALEEEHRQARLLALPRRHGMWLLGRRLIDAALPLNTSCLCCSISQPCITCPCSLPVQAQGEGDPRLAKRLRYLNNRAALRAAVVGGASGDGAQGSSGPRVADGGRAMGRSSSPLLGRPLAAACTPRFDSICAQLRGATPAPCLLRSLVPFRGVCTGYRKYDVRKRHTELCPSLSPHSCSHFILSLIHISQGIVR